MKSTRIQIPGWIDPPNQREQPVVALLAFHGSRNEKGVRVKLVINCVTRGRPQRLVETVAHTMRNTVEPETRLLVSIDDDDIESLTAISSFSGDPRIIPVVRPGEDSLGEKFNRVLQYPGDVYMPLADYTHIVTPAFDRKILEAASLFPDNIGVVYNHMANASFPSIWCVTHGLAQKMGSDVPALFSLLVC